MKYADLIDKTNNLIDETDFDEQIDIIVKTSLNEAYSILCKRDRRFTRAYLPIINGVCTLPNNLYEMVSVEPKLSGGDKVEGTVILTDKKGVFNILYAYSREQLFNDNDEPDLHETLQYAMINYACAKYYEHRKKSEVANLFMSTFDRIVGTFGFEDNDKLYHSEETIQFV